MDVLLCFLRYVTLEKSVPLQRQDYSISVQEKRNCLAGTFESLAEFPFMSFCWDLAEVAVLQLLTNILCSRFWE